MGYGRNFQAPGEKTVRLGREDLEITAKQLLDLLRDMKKSFKMTRSAEDRFISIQIERDREKRLIKIHQTAYLKKILERFSMMDCYPAESPHWTDLVLGRNVDKDGKALEAYKAPYRQFIGSRMFASIATRADAAYIVSQLSQFLECPSKEHWQSGKGVLRYLEKTIGLGIVYAPVPQPDRLEAFSDASWASELESRKSITGVMEES